VHDFRISKWNTSSGNSWTIKWTPRIDILIQDCQSPNRRILSRTIPSSNFWIINQLLALIISFKVTQL
jgi:hypothetical protein